MCFNRVSVYFMYTMWISNFTMTENDARIATCKICSAEILRGGSLLKNFTINLSPENTLNIIKS